MSERRSLLGGLSWPQIVVGALAAMTSAWIASTLGVGGTIIGAAVGSLVIPISSDLYRRTLDKGRVLVVRTDRGTTIRQPVDTGSDADIVDEVADANPDVRDAAVVDEPPRLHWKTILLTAVLVLALAVAAMGAFELVSGQAYGSDPDNARITNPFGPGRDDPTDEPTPTPTAATPTPTDAPTPSEATPTQQPSPEPTDEPTVDVE